MATFAIAGLSVSVFAIDFSKEFQDAKPVVAVQEAKAKAEKAVQAAPKDDCCEPEEDCCEPKEAEEATTAEASEFVQFDLGMSGVSVMLPLDQPVEDEIYTESGASDLPDRSRIGD